MWRERLKSECLGVEEGRLLLEEYRTYYLRIPRDELEQLAEIQGFLEQLGDYDLYALNFGSCLGDFHVAGLEVRVVSPKLTRGQYYLLLSEISAYTVGLPFFFRGGKEGYVKTAKPSLPLLYHLYIYLEGLLQKGEIEAALMAVLSDPYTRYLKETFLCPVEVARKVGPLTLRAVLREPRHLVRIPESSRISEGGFGRRLHHHFPQNVRLERLQGTLDSPENRFIKYFLELCREIAGWATGLEHLGNRACNTESRLGRLLKMPFFAAFSPLHSIPYNSQVLQKKRGYREIFTFFNRLNLLIDHAPVEKWADLIEVKDAATLYEYWTFIKIAGELEKLLGRPLRADGAGRDEEQMYLPYTLKIEYSGDTILWYNKTFVGSGKGSYSVALRPDVVLERGNACYVFDAKFRIERISTDELLAPGESRETDRTFKKQDIHKMHTYRDAIKGCQGAFTVYPGHETRLFPIDEEMPHQGVGALGLIPGGDSAMLVGLMRRMLD